VTPEEIIRTWGENDSVITCVRVPLELSQATCELCECWIAALAGSRMKARQLDWHLICRDCFNRFFPELKKHCGEVKWGGRFHTEEQARKVLPR
jgi:hypothetical protein